MGDPQCTRLKGAAEDYSHWGSLLQAAVRHEMKSDAGVHAGGEAPAGRRLLVLGGDIVNRGNKAEEWRSFIGELEKVTDPDSAGREGVKIVTPVTGSAESIGAYKDYFYNPGNGPAGYEKNFFSFDYGCVHFLVLDSEYMGRLSRDAGKYIGYWIKGDLAANTRPVTMAVMHQPMFTVGESFEDDVHAKAMKDGFLVLLHKYGVDFILCGHQHVYCRTPEITDGRYDGGLTQVMGVSGTKFFEAYRGDGMAACREFTSVATVFSTDGETIRMETVGAGGNVVDTFAKKVRRAAERRCSTCINFGTCRGTGEYEIRQAEEKARRLGDPLKPRNSEGIVVRRHGDDSLGNRGEGGEPPEILLTDKAIKGLPKVRAEYSVRLRDGLHCREIEGFALEDVLALAGVDINRVCAGDTSRAGSRTALIFTGENGKQRILEAGELLKGGCYGEDPARLPGEGSGARLKHPVPAMITEEPEGYRLVFGQRDPGHFNARQWAAGIREIDILITEG